MGLSELFAWEVLGRRLREYLLVPGDYVLWWLRDTAPPVAALLGLDSPDTSFVPAIVISIVFWVTALWAIRSLVRAIIELDRALTAWLVNCAYAVLNTARATRTWVLCLLRRLAEPDAGREPVTTRNVEISTLEGALLRAQLRVVPGSVATARDLAVDLAISAKQAREALERLARLGLVEAHAAAGKPGYRLTRSGRLFTEARASR